MDLPQVGVMGAGTIGAGVAQASAQSRCSTILYDVSEDALQTAKLLIRAGLRAINLKRPADQRVAFEEIQTRLVFTTDIAMLFNAKIIVENVPEDWEIKRQLYRKLSTIIADDAHIFANTSVIPIAKIAAEYKCPGQVAGMHFMNPVPLKKTVEVIRGQLTSVETLQSANQFLNILGKKGITVRDSPGFVSNRVLMLTINEAIFLLQEEVASAKDIDAIFKECFAHAMGPLETADLIGNDTILHSLKLLHENFNDSKFQPCPLLTSMVSEGMLGRKSGRGFYEY